MKTKFISSKLITVNQRKEHDMNKDGLNVYIATLPRSGSTMLGMMLGNNPLCSHVGESSYWGKLNPKNVKCSCGKVGCDVLKRVYSKIKNNNNVYAIYNACSIIDYVEEPSKTYHDLSLPHGGFTADMVDKLEVLLNLSCYGIEKITDVYREITKRNIVADNTKNIRIAEYLARRKG